jgi:hypothetical protein
MLSSTRLGHDNAKAYPVVPVSNIYRDKNFVIPALPFSLQMQLSFVSEQSSS